MVTHILLLKLHQSEATVQRRSWVKQQATLFFDLFPQGDFKWRTPIDEDLSKWDGLILIETKDRETIQKILESTSYRQWLEQIDPYLACVKGWSFTL